MTALATTTRLAVATALESTGRVVHAQAPNVPIPPCLVVVPDQAWISPNRVGSPQRYELRLRVMCVGRDNAEGLADLEQAVEDAMGAVASIGLITQVSPPMSTDLGAQGSVLVAEMHRSIQVKE